MKILKYILYAVGVLIILFFVMGLLNPTVEYGHEITVNKSVQEAWAVTQDEDKYADWLKGFKSIELIEGEKGKVGSKYKVVVNPGEGQEDFEMIETVLSVKEYDHVTMHFDSEGMVFGQTITFSETDGKTSIKTESTVSADNLIARSGMAVAESLFGVFTAQETENIENLKKLIEENTTDYYPAPEIAEDEELVPEEAGQ